jgi:Protein of unknown function (DUF3551)
MRKFLYSSATIIAALGALTTVATPASAHTYEYCRRDIIGYTMSCSFDTLAQCQAMSSGRGGDCMRDPYLSDIRSSYARVKDTEVKALAKTPSAAGSSQRPVKSAR